MPALATLRASSLRNPCACSSLNMIQMQFSIQDQANPAGNTFYFGGPDRNNKPLLWLRVSSRLLQVFSSLFETTLEFLNSSLEALREGPPYLEI